MARRKLLLADDSITIQKVVNLTFADEGIDVVTVGDGNAALTHLAAETPDILLADVNMPGPTGYEICEQLRANEATRGVPVILLVGSFEPFDEAEATRVGANAYLTKPFQSIKQLIAQVNELMDAAGSAETQHIPELPEPADVEPVVEEQSLVEEPVAAEFQPTQAAEPAPKVFDDLGYEVHAHAPETSASESPAADDIDSLYEQSVAGDDLSDVGIDDEMIETSYSAAQANDEFASFATETTLDTGAEEPSGEPEVSTQPAAEYESSPIEGNGDSVGAESQDEIGFRSGYEQRFPDDPSRFENTIAYEDWQPADMRESDSPQHASHASEPERLQPLDTTPLDDPHAGAAQSQDSPVGEDTIRMENRFDTTGSSFEFDDTDLLDLSANGQTAVEITSPVNAVEQGADKQVVTLSPELIEMIAQRVVEKLSEKY